MPMRADAHPSEQISDAIGFSLLMDAANTQAGADVTMPVPSPVHWPHAVAPVVPQDSASEAVETGAATPADIAAPYPFVLPNVELPQAKTPVTLGEREFEPASQDTVGNIKPKPILALTDDLAAHSRDLSGGDNVQSTEDAAAPVKMASDSGTAAFLARLRVNSERHAPVLASQTQVDSQAALPVLLTTSDQEGKISTDQNKDHHLPHSGGAPKIAWPDLATASEVDRVSIVGSEGVEFSVQASDAVAWPMPQPTGFVGADPTLAPPGTTTSLPLSVPTTLLAHAPAATGGAVEIILDPEELGKIRFEIHQQGDLVKVVLAVERPETLDLLRRHADQLIQEFRSAGFAGASLDFGQWGRQRSGTSGQVADVESDKSAADLALNMGRPVPMQNTAPAQGLNLRL